MNPKFKNNKASRSLEAIIAGTDDEKVESGISEMVADSENEEPESVEEVEDEDEEPQEITDEDLVEEGSDVDDDEGDDEETTDAEGKACKESVGCGDGEDANDDNDDEDEGDDDEEGDDDAGDDEDDDDSETLDDEPIAEEEVEEITDAEVKAYQESVGCGDGEDCDDDDDDEEPEEQPIEDTMDEEKSSEDEDGEDDDEEDEEPVDDEATTEAVAHLVKAGFTCSVDGKGKIAVTACGEEVEGCDCKCDKKKEEEACVTLRPVAEGEKVDSKEVTAVLHGEDSENPSYTILISGTPVAAIYLQDQPNAEALRGYFLKNEYPRKLISAMAQGGVKEVLDTQHAKMFAAVANKSELAKAMKAEAKAEYDKQLSEAIAGVANKFASAVKLAVAGMNKNFFTEDNNLKAAAYASFTELGCDKAVAYEKVNKVFAEAEGYFDTVIAKAMELMGKSDEAFNEIAGMVATAGVANNQTTSFAQKLAEGNNPVIASVQKEEEVARASTTAKIKSMRLFR